MLRGETSEILSAGVVSHCVKYLRLSWPQANAEDPSSLSGRTFSWEMKSACFLAPNTVYVCLYKAQ